jgi:DNA-binding MarR family transcriptional regulator
MAKPDSISPLNAHAGYWLRWVSNHVSHAFRLKVEAHGVTVAEWVLLRQLLDSGEAHPSQLAESLGMTRGAISKLIDRLSAKGHVLRASAAGDRRYQTVRLAPSGRKLVPILAALADRNDAEFFGHFSPAERAALIATLKEIVNRRQLKGVPVD